MLRIVGNTAHNLLAAVLPQLRSSAVQIELQYIIVQRALSIQTPAITPTTTNTNRHIKQENVFKTWSNKSVKKNAKYSASLATLHTSPWL